MATINLAPGAQYLASIRRRRRFLIGLTTAIFLVTTLTWLGAYLYVKSIEGNIARAQTELQQLETQLAALKPDLDRIMLFEGRLTTLKTLLDNHISWVPLLAEIEKLLPPPIVLTTVTVQSDTGIVDVIGNAPDVDQIAQTLASLTAARQPAQLFTEGEILSAQRTQVSGSDGQAVGAEYRFTAKVHFDSHRLTTSGASTPR